MWVYNLNYRILITFYLVYVCTFISKIKKDTRNSEMCLLSMRNGNILTVLNYISFSLSIATCKIRY